MRAAVELKVRLGIWRSYDFLDLNNGSSLEALVDCENGHVKSCRRDDGKPLQRKDATKLLDEHFG